MDTTISKNLYTNKYEVKKWNDNNVIETYTTKKKHLAYEVFSKWCFGKNK